MRAGEKVRKLASRLLPRRAVIMALFDDGSVTCEGQRFESIAEARAAYSDRQRFRVVVVRFDTILKEV